jgi:hypothetical protein
VHKVTDVACVYGVVYIILHSVVVINFSEAEIKAIAIATLDYSVNALRIGNHGLRKQELDILIGESVGIKAV